MSAIVAASPARPTLVRAVCVREWREALGNKLLVGMTLLPPVVILATGVLAVGAAAINPPSERDDLILGHVFSDMRQQDRVEPAWAVVLRMTELIGCERGQAPRAGLAHAVFVDVDPYALFGEMRKVAADPATDVERHAGIETPQVPAVDGLDIEPSLPRGRPAQPLRVFLSVSRDTWRIYARDHKNI